MRLLLCAAAMVSILGAPIAWSADTLYKWVDKNGNVTYQDQPPPNQSGDVETMVEQGNATPESPRPDVSVVLYSIKVCDACDLVRHILQERGIPFREKNAEGDADVQAEIKKLAGVLSVPVLTIGDEVLTGYNRALILKDLTDAGFPTSAQSSGQQTQGQQAQQAQKKPLTRKDLEGMTPEEIQQAYRDAIARGEDNDLFQEDKGFATLNEDPFPNEKSDQPVHNPDDVTNLEEIPKDEQIQVSQ